MRLKFLKENLIDEKSIIKILKDYIDISRKPKLGSVFLTKDGTFINLGENEDDSHGDIISYLENEDIFLFDDHWQFSENFGYIRMNSGTTTDFNAYIEFLEDKPTSEQYDGIENWLYYVLNSGVKEVEINVPNSKSIRYSLVDYLPEDIIKKVKRYYGSGNLYESASSTIDIDWDGRGWILENGKIISTNNGPHYEKDHLVDQESNVVRYNFGYERYIGLPKNNLTSAQYNTLEELLDLFFIGRNGVGERSRNIEINCSMNNKGDFISKIYNPFEYTPDDIIKKIKRYYSSGILYESSSNTTTIKYKSVSDTDKFKKYADEILGGYGGMSDSDIKRDIEEIYIDGELKGYIGLSKYNEEDGTKLLGIGNFMIIERGKGYGTQVINDIVSKYKSKYDLIYCFVDSDNEGAISLYKKLGKVYDEDGPNDNGQYYVTFYDNGKYKLEEDLNGDININDIETPEQLMDWMESNITYELANDEYGVEDDPPTKTAEEVIATGTGHCAEQSYLEYKVLDELGYFPQLVFIKENNSKKDYGADGSAHMFVVYQDDYEKYVYFEHSQEHNKGIHKFDSMSELLDFVGKNWWRYDANSDILEVRYIDEPIAGVDNWELAQECHKYPVDEVLDISNNVMEEDVPQDAKWDYNKHKIIEEKWEIADMEQDDPVEADVFVSDDVRDIIREIKGSSHWEYYKFVLDENKGLYIMLDPFYTIHDDAFDFVVENYWYPELINNGNDAYGDYKSKHWNTKLIYIMVTFGVDEKGLPKDLGQDFFDYAYMYPNFNILTRTTNFTNTELYKLLGKEDKFMDVSKYSGIQEKLNKDDINESVSEKISLYHGTNSIIKGKVRLPLFLADNKWDSYRYGKNLYKFNVNLNKPFTFDYDCLEELGLWGSYDKNEEIINEELCIYDEDLWNALVEIFDGYTISYGYLIEIVQSLGKYDSIVLYNSPVGHGHIDQYIILKQDCIIDYNKVLNEDTINDNGVDMSSEQDSEGNILTVEQAKYFSNSKVKDKSGRLLVCYHSTDNEFDEFDSSYSWDNFGFHFGTKEAAEDIGGEIIKSCYLNITNPLILKEDLQYWDAFSFIRLLYENPQLQKDIKIDGWEEIKEHYELDIEREEFDESFYCAEYGDVVRDALYNSKYDGIIYTNWGEDAGSISYMCFYPEQIKYIDNKSPTRSKRMNEGTYDDEEEDISEQITNEFLDVWDDFYHCSTEDVLDLLEYTPSDKIDASSPMFILPNGKIVNVADVLEQWGYEYPLVHHALPQVMAYVILKDICSRYGVEAEQFMYEEDGLLDNVTDEMIHNLTYSKDWARINCGTLAVESRFYCVLPNHMKSAQYYTLEEWLLWGEQHNKKEVLVFCGNEQQNQKYKFDGLFVEGIMKKIKRFYSSGVLHEGKDNRKVLYRGEGDSNYSVGRTPMAGLFYATDYDDASNFSDNVVKYELNSNSKIYKGQSSLNYCIENDLMNIQDEDLKNMLGVSTLIDMYEENSVPDGYFPKDEYLDDRPFFGTQLIAKKDLQKKGYDGAYWKWEDDLTPQQYQIWNMSVVEKLDQIKEDFSNIDKSEYLKFQSYVESIIDRKIKIVNRELDKFGFEVEYIDDYDFTENDEWIGVFCNEIQDAADVFPIAINIPFLYRECKKDKYLKDDLPYHIEKTIWHEVGHGIFEYLYDVFDLEDLDEEEVVEEYASYQVGDMNSPGDLLDYLYQYLEDN